MDIEVGEYCRTTEGYIGKYTKEVITNKTLELEDNDMTWITGIFDIVKHSKNIIDLIEEDDFVNNEEVDKIKNEGIYNDGEKYIKTVFNNVYRNKDIKTIVTKEQFQNIEYKVEK